MSIFKEWTCIFPGKMGLSWKIAWGMHPVPTTGTKEAAEQQADKNCNVIAVPLQLYEHIKDMEHRMVEAEQKVLRVDKKE